MWEPELIPLQIEMTILNQETILHDFPISTSKTYKERAQPAGISHDFEGTQRVTILHLPSDIRS